MSTHRVASYSVGGFALVAAIAFAATLQTSAVHRNAHHVLFDDTRHAAVIYSEGGDLLFTIPIPSNTSTFSWRFVESTPSTQIVDLDGDGRVEVVTMVPVVRKDGIARNVLRVFRSDGSTLWERTLGEQLTYRNEVFTENYQLKGLAIRDFDADGQMEILVGAAHYHSPYILYRLNSDGAELGQYRTYGHLSHVYPTDLEFDGSFEVILCGQLDEADFQRRPIVVALDPNEVNGKSEASFAPGFGLPPSKAERFAIRLPWSHIDSATTNPKPRVTDINFESRSEIRFVVTTEVGEIRSQIDYSISRDFVPLQVQWTDGLREAHASLKKMKKIGGDLTPERGQRLIQSVEYWDGSQWGNDLDRPPKLGSGLSRLMWNPVRANLNGLKLELINEFGRVLQALPVTRYEATILTNGMKEGEIYPNKLVFMDCNGDSLNELILYRRKETGSRGEVSLVCLSVNGLSPLWEKHMRWDITFPKKTDDIPSEYGAGLVYVEDLESDGSKDLIALVGNMNMFPGIITRLDPRTGGELNTYLHIGQIDGLTFEDIDLDGRPEILAGGRNNAYNEAVFMALPGNTFAGVSPHTPEYAPNGWKSGNEIAYVRFPRTIVGEYFWATSAENAFASVDLMPKDQRLQVWIQDFKTPFSADATTVGALGVVFSYDMTPLKVSTGSFFDAVARRLRREGKISRTPDATYWHEYLSSIQAWNGASWVSKYSDLSKNEHSRKEQSSR